MTFGDSPPPGWPPNQGGGQQGVPGQYGYGPGQFGPVGYGGPPPRPSRGPRLWLASSGVVVVAAVVVIALVLTGGSGGHGQQSGGTAPATTSTPDPTPPTPTSRTATSTTPTSTTATSAIPRTVTTAPATTAAGAMSVGPQPGQKPPTTDRLPSNSGSSSCDQSGYPDLVTVSVVTVLGLADKGGKPDTFVAGVLRDCTSAAVRSKISALFGTDINYTTGSDLTGKDGRGATAKYLLHGKSGAKLAVTLTRQRDGHYEITGYVYTP